MIKFKKSDWIARLLHDANEVPHRCCFNENQITKRFRAGFSQVAPDFHSCSDVPQLERFPHEFLI